VRGINFCDLCTFAQPLSPRAFCGYWSGPALVELPPGVSFGPVEDSQSLQEKALAHASDLQLYLLSECGTPLRLGLQGALAPREREGVAQEHAELIYRESRWWVRDLDGRGRTQVAGRSAPAERSLAIREGQVLSLGRAEFVLLEPSQLYRWAHAAIAGAAPLELPRGGVPLAGLIGLGVPNWLGTESGPFLLEVSTDSVDSGDSTLSVSVSAAQGRKSAGELADTRVHALPKGKVIEIGRGSSCDVRLHDPSVSKTHARLVSTSEEMTRIVDLGSANGTRIGSDALPVGITREVGIGQSLRLGSCLCMLIDWARLRDLADMVSSRQARNRPA
jgi:pSer/pThr/pTyr-binding forkhead associated (FHA) protein